MLTRLLLAVTVVVLATPAPALAHGADAPDATNYRTAITAIPQLAGLDVRTIEAGARLQVTNKTGKNIEILGYQGEPYLEIRPDGVYTNYHSPATYLNITIAHIDPPAHADATVPPLWQKVSDEPTYRWHDQRTLWTELTPPPEVAAAPGDPHHIRDWIVPMRVDATPLQLTGTLDWVAPPTPWFWWLAAIAGAAVIGLLGLARKSRAITIGMSAIAISAGVLALIYAVGRERDAGNETLGPILAQLFTAQLWTTVTALAALAAGGYALLRRRGDADFALALGASAVALFAGMTNAAVFHRSITPVPWSADIGRTLIALIIALGAGVAIAAMLRLRGTAPSPVPSPRVQ